MISLLITHFISDFVLQRREVAVKKSSDGFALLEHGGIIFLCFLPFGFELSILNASIHMLIDIFIWRGYKFIRRKENKETFKYWEDGLFYTTIGFDQFLHVSTLVLLKGCLL